MHFNVEESAQFGAGVYCLICYPTGDMYIGSTGNLFERYKGHCTSINTSDRFLYRKLSETGVENFSFELMEPFAAFDRPCMLAFERALIAALRPSLNVNIGGRDAGNRDKVKYGFAVTSDEHEIIRQIAALRKASWFQQAANISDYDFARLRDKGVGSEACITKVQKFIKSSARLGKLLSSIGAYTP